MPAASGESVGPAKDVDRIGAVVVDLARANAKSLKNPNIYHPTYNLCLTSFYLPVKLHVNFGNDHCGNERSRYLKPYIIVSHHTYMMGALSSRGRGCMACGLQSLVKAMMVKVSCRS